MGGICEGAWKEGVPGIPQGVNGGISEEVHEGNPDGVIEDSRKEPLEEP